jgi:uncharacterized protein (TIRG00374 family)
MKKWLALGAKILVSGALIWFLFRDVDLDSALGRVRAADTALLVMGLSLMLLQTAVVSWRWKIVLDVIRAPLPYAKTFRYFYISAFFNQALPASVGGDAVRIYKAHKAGLSLGSAFNSAMLDRVAALVAIVVMMVASLPWLFERIADPASRVGIGVMVALALGGVIAMTVLDKTPAALHRWRIVRALAVLAGDARRTFLDPRRTPSVMGVAVLGHVNLALAVWALGRSLDLEITVLDSVLLFPPVLLVSSLPVSIAGWGVREGAMVAAFGFVGVPADGALVLSILFGLAMIVVNLPGGALWLIGGEKLPPETLADAEPAEPSGQ